MALRTHHPSCEKSISVDAASATCECGWKTDAVNYLRFVCCQLIKEVKRVQFLKWARNVAKSIETDYDAAKSIDEIKLDKRIECVEIYWHDFIEIRTVVAPQLNQEQKQLLLSVARNVRSLVKAYRLVSQLEPEEQTSQPTWKILNQFILDCDCEEIIDELETIMRRHSHPDDEKQTVQSSDGDVDEDKPGQDKLPRKPMKLSWKNAYRAYAEALKVLNDSDPSTVWNYVRENCEPLVPEKRSTFERYVREVERSVGDMSEQEAKEFFAEITEI